MNNYKITELLYQSDKELINELEIVKSNNIKEAANYAIDKYNIDALDLEVSDDNKTAYILMDQKFYDIFGNELEDIEDPDESGIITKDQFMKIEVLN